MPFLKINLALAFVAFAALAESSAPPEAPAAGAEPGPAGSATAAEYVKKVSELTSLENKVKESRAAIQKMIQDKNATADRTKKQALVREMVQRHEQLKTEVDQYNKTRNEVKYRFPAKDEITDAKYIPLRHQSLEQIEREMGLDDDLTRIKKTVDRTYRPFLEAESGVSGRVVPGIPAKASVEDEKPKRLKLAR